MKKIHKLSFTLLAIICSLFFMHGTITDTYADDSITLTIDTSNINLNLTSTSSSGKFAESTPASISVSTTSTSGYTLSLASTTDSTDLTNTTDNTSKITSISDNLTNTDFSNSSNIQFNNKWGYKPSQYVTTDGGTSVTHANTGANAVFKPLPSQSGEILAITDEANQQGTSDTYTISMGARVNSDTKTGSYQSEPFIIMAVANSNVVECDDSKLCIQFDGNGLTFPETSTQVERFVNNVNYNSGTAQQQVTKYSHTTNISDAGVASGTYASSLDTTDTVTIDGATSLNVTIYYDAEYASYDWVSVYQSPFNISDANDAIISTTTGNLSGKLSGRNSGRTTTYSSWYTQSYTVIGDTAKFHFKSDNGSNYYGYYAIITGIGTVPERVLTSGEYVTPTGANPLFHGWSSVATTPGGGLPFQVEYADEAAVKSKLPGDNGEAKTLYAVWQQPQQITFTKDSNVTSIEVIDSNGNTVGTITTSGQSLALPQGSTYTIKPTYFSDYTIDTISKTTGEGSVALKLPNADFIVGAGVATINVTSIVYNPSSCQSSTMITTILPSITYMQDINSSNKANVLSSLTTNSTYQIKDSRDNLIYCVGKLADGNLWLLDNLALDLTDSTVLNGMNENNTNASNTTLDYLKGITTRDPSTDPDSQYATAGVSNWTTSYSYSAPLVNLTNKDTNPSDAMSQAGQFKVGGYYNYCATSAGSYCYGNGTSYGYPSGDATEDICPKGWKIPASINGDYRILYDKYNTQESYRSALRLPFAGILYNNGLYSQGSKGYFWSSSEDTNDKMFSAYIDNAGTISPMWYEERYYGLSVRCLLPE